MRGVVVARAHGCFNVIGGLWPLVSIGTFERVTGPKVDKWLVRTVAGLMVANGLTQLRSDSSREALKLARQLGQGTAVVLAVIDLVYAPRGRISKVYLLDAAVELGWVALWSAARPDVRHHAAPPGSGEHERGEGLLGGRRGYYAYAVRSAAFCAMRQHVTPEVSK
jgi:hypothetical protein